MTKTLDEFVWVYVGCGGTFYAAVPYLAILQRRCGFASSIFVIDPDVVERGDQNRQWPGWTVGTDKTSAAWLGLGIPHDHNRREIVEAFSPDHPVLARETEGKPVLAIVNVDNDQCRLEVAEWLASRMSPGIMIVSGCERDFGQCYPGVWNEGNPILDWRECHPDVGTSSGEGHQCGLQTIRSNALTGVLVGLCLEDVADWLEHRTGNYTRDGYLMEFYWEAPVRHTFKMWDTPVGTRRGAIL